MSQFAQTSIIIPTYNGLNLLTSCIASIRQHTPEAIEIIVVDNGSQDQTVAYCISEGITVISIPSNQGFPIACNKGLSIASGQNLLLLNNDVLVTPRWLTNMLTALESHPKIGMVGPTSNYVSGKQQISDNYNSIAEFMDAAEHNNHSDPQRWEETRRLVGMCLLFKREVLQRVGSLDERFSPGHYEDDDYCYRACLEGYRLLICHDTLVYHAGSQSFRRDHPSGWQDLIERNRGLFMEKWGVNPWDFM